MICVPHLSAVGIALVAIYAGYLMGARREDRAWEEGLQRGKAVERERLERRARRLMRRLDDKDEMQDPDNWGAA